MWANESNGPLAGYRIIELAGIGPGPFAAMLLADMGAEVDPGRARRSGSRAGPRHRARRRHVARPAQRRHRPQAARRRRRAARPRRASRCPDRRLPPRCDGAPRCRTRRVPRPQSAPRVRADDGLGTGRSVGPRRRSRHQLHRPRRGARPLPPCRPAADAAAEHGRRLRRGSDVPRLRRGLRPARGAAQRVRPGRRRSDGRRHGVADDDVLDAARDRRVRREAPGTQPARHRAPTSTTSTSAPTARSSRSAHSSRSSTPNCCGVSASTATRRSPPRWIAVAWPHLKERLAEVFRSRTRDEWCALFDGTDVCFAPVLTMSEAAEHPHNVARGTFVEVDGRVQPAPGAAIQPDSGDRSVSPPAHPGQHSREVLADWGLPAERIEALVGVRRGRRRLTKSERSSVRVMNRSMDHSYGIAHDGSGWRHHVAGERSVGGRSAFGCCDGGLQRADDRCRLGVAGPGRRRRR